MNSKNFVWAGLAGGITYFLLGWLFYGILLMDFMQNMAGSATGVDRGEDMIMWAIFVGNLASGFLLSYIFTQIGNVNTAAAGAKTGFWLGALLSAGVDFVMYGTTNLMILRGVLLDVLVFAVLSAIAGTVVGWVISKAKA